MQIKTFDAFLAIFLAIIIAELLQQTAGGWGWDINHMMYFGQRLLSGDFHWTQEYDDKLPVLQIIFTLPAAFDSIAIWRAMSLTCMVAGATAVFVIIDYILLQSTKIGSKGRFRYAALGGASSLYLATFFPGGLHHINASAASLAAITLALLTLSFRSYKFRYSSFVLLVSSALSASVSIGVRPYFLVPLTLGAVWLFFRVVKSREDLLPAFGASVVWICLVGMFGILVNGLPYVLLGNTEVFFSGMSMLGQTLNPQGIAESAVSIVKTIDRSDKTILAILILSLASCLYSASVLSAKNDVYPIGTITRRTLFLDVIAFAFVVPVALLASILGRHFWPHYLQMFGPFIGIGCALFFALLHDKISKMGAVGNRMLTALGISYTVLFALPSIASDLKFYLASRPEHRLDQMVRSVEEIVLEQPVNRRSFLFLDSMYTHWKLSEPRHGFPHAAHTGHIINNNWWVDVKMPPHFSHPITSDQYCSEIGNYGPSIVIAGGRHSKFSSGCMSELSNYSHYRELTQYRLNIFIRD